MPTLAILCVGDAPGSTDVIEAFQRVPSMTFLVAEGIDEALAHVEAGGVDCVVSDYELPEGDGLALFESVRAVDRTVPFVLYTAHGSERVAADAVSADVTAYVPRTAENPAIGALVERVERACADVNARARAVADGGVSTLAAELDLKETAMDEAPVGITIGDLSKPDNELVYVNDAFERLTGYDKSYALGRNCRFLQGEESDPEAVSAMRRAVEDRRPVAVELINYRKDGEPFWNRVELAPVYGDGGEATHMVGFQTDVTERKEAQLRAERTEAELRAQRRTLARVLARIDGLLERVTAVVVDSNGRTELERRVCEAIVETTEYRSAWIGDRELTANRIAATAQANCGELGPIQVDLDGECPTVRAYRTGSVAVGSSDSVVTPTHQRLAGHDGAVVAVPIRYSGANYGVLTVYTARGDAFDVHEETILGSLGKLVGTGINALENQRLLTTDEFLELTFESAVPGPFFVELARRADCTLRYNGAVTEADGGYLLSFVADGATADAVVAAGAGLDGVADVMPVATYDDSCLVEIRPTGESIIQTVLDHNGSVRSIVADADGAKIRVELPQTSNPRAVAEALCAYHDGLSLVAQRRRERTQTTRTEFVESLRSQLTARQLEAVQKAYLADYFEWPRPVSGDEIAASMEITRTTFHQHLRAAQAKIIAEFLDGDPN